MSTHQIIEIMSAEVVSAVVRPPSTIVIICLLALIVLLIRVLMANARDMAGVASTAIGGAARSLVALAVVGAVLMLLVVVLVDSGPKGIDASPTPTLVPSATVAPGVRSATPVPSGTVRPPR